MLLSQVKRENNMTQSEILFKRAKQIIPGGVDSPVRAFGAVGGTPRFINRGEGAYIFDEDNNQYIDYVGSWGPMILGHAHPAVIQAVQHTASNSLGFGAATKGEIELAERIRERMPSMEKVRLVNSGTEATMTAIRLARGFTGKDKIIKFNGCYHGHSDGLLVSAGSGALTFGTPSSPGVPKATVKDTLVAEFNDIGSVKSWFDQYPNDIACIIIEPIAGNMNMMLPKEGFLQELHDLCKQYNSLLVLDEVMTGFRVALGGAQALYDIKPDLTTIGKIMGGGLPAAAFGGRAEIMDYLSPEGPVYQAGTLSGNPVTVAAGLATLNELTDQSYQQLSDMSNYFTTNLAEYAKVSGIPISTISVGGMFGLFFTKEPTVDCFKKVMQCNQAHFRQFFQSMLEQGHYFAPSPFEAGFISLAHSKADIDSTLNAASNAFEQMV